MASDALPDLSDIESSLVLKGGEINIKTLDSSRKRQHLPEFQDWYKPSTMIVPAIKLSTICRMGADKKPKAEDDVYWIGKLATVAYLFYRKRGSVRIEKCGPRKKTRS